MNKEFNLSEKRTEKWLNVEDVKEFIRLLKKSNYQNWESSWGDIKKIFSISEDEINDLVGNELL